MLQQEAGDHVRVTAAQAIAVPQSLADSLAPLNEAAVAYAQTRDIEHVYATYEALLGIDELPAALERFLVRTSARSASMMRRPRHAQSLMELLDGACGDTCVEESLQGAEILFELDKFAEANALFASAFAAMDDAPPRPWTALARAIAAGPYALSSALTGNVDHSLRLLRDAEAIIRAQDDPGISADFLTMQASIQAYLGDLTQAEQYRLQAQAAYQTAGDLRGLAETWLELSTTWRATGRYVEAIDAAQTALSLINQMLYPDALVGPAYQHLADVYERLGDHQRHLQFVLLAHEQEVNTGREARAMALLRLVGTARRRSGNLEGALGAHTEALNYFLKEGDSWRILLLRQELALDQLALGNLAEASAQMDYAWTLRVSAHGRIDLGSLIASRGRVLRMSGDTGRARTFLAAHWGVKDTSSPSTIAIGHELMLSQAAQGAARDAIDTGLRLIERIEAQLFSLEPHRLGPAWASLVNPIYADLAAIYLRSQDEVEGGRREAFEVITCGRALALRRQYFTRQTARDNERTRLQEVLSEIDDERARLDADSAREEQLARRRMTIAEQLASLDAGAVPVPSTPAGHHLTFEGVREQIPPQTTALQYFCSTLGCWVFTLDGDGLRSAAIDAQALTSLTSAIEPTDRAPIDEFTARALSEVLLAPLLLPESTRTLVISGDHTVDHVPFTMLWSNDTTRLGDRYDIVHMPTLAAFEVREDVLDIENVTVIADPAFATTSTLPNANVAQVASWTRELPRLPWSQLEARGMLQFYGAATRIFVGEEATAANLLTAATLSSDVLHI
ncbi:MAG: CHAT domain-containing protein, partial [Pseudomonadota bacterium]